jgi:malate synthase
LTNTCLPKSNSRKTREDISDGTGLTRNSKGTITVEGIRKNISISVLYASWLNGQGAAALHNLMEDAATAEISRSQLWQWLQNKVILDNGKILNESYYRLAMEEFEKKKFSWG